MYRSTHYIMCDQVQGFVPDLMSNQRARRPSRLRILLEIATFLSAALAYLVALALAA